MTNLPARRPIRVRLALLAAGVLLLATAVTVLVTTPKRVARRIRAAAAERGLDATWGTLALRPPFRIVAREMAFTRAGTDTVALVDSLDVGVDPMSLLMLAPRVSRLAASSVVVSLRSLRPAAADTLAPPPRARERRLRANQLPRIRRGAERLVRLLLLPPERLPQLSLRDVTVRPEADADEGEAETIHFEQLELAQQPNGSRLVARGETRLERLVPFQGTVDYGRNGRIAGHAEIVFGDGPRDTLKLSIAAGLERRASPPAMRLVPGSRILIGAIPIDLTGSLEAVGPRARAALVARDVSEADVLQSVPAPMLGPLTRVHVRGAFDYELSFDVDLARPDSLAFHADVLPRDLALDTKSTSLPLVGLETPFTATIHLPRGRLETRALDESNPHFRTLDRIDSTLARAVVTNEDGGFFRHRGFNTEAMRQAFAENLRAGAYRRGAGTITMQLARNLYLGHERTLSRKGQEVVLAWILEHLSGVSKRRVLEIYLNIIEWGPRVHGADEASRYYFDHDAGKLTVDEALFLATIVPAPSRWRWRFDAEGNLRHYAQAQMHFIGRAMIAKGWLDADRLPATDSLRVELRGAAREVLFPRPDSSRAEPRVMRPQEKHPRAQRKPGGGNASRKAR